MSCKICSHCRAELARRRVIDHGVLLPRIVESAALIVGVNALAIYARDKTDPVSWAREIAYYLMRDLTAFSFPQIGRLFGRDHSTIYHGYQTVRDRISVHRDDALTVAKVRARALRGLSKSRFP